MKVSEQLRAAKALISNPAQHLQNGLYADAGIDTMGSSPWSEDACRFCSIGAAAKIAGVGNEDDLHKYHIAGDMVRYLDEATGSVTIAPFNDTRSHEEVMAIWDKAICLAERDEAELAGGV